MKSLTSVAPSGHVRPAISSQVTIQSEEEKKLIKRNRKEERKIAKQVKALQSFGVEDHEAQVDLLGFNPEELRKER